METSDKPIQEYRTDYLDWIDVEKGLADATQENYARFLQRFFDWLDDNDLADLKPHELNENHIWEYRIYLARRTTRSNSDQNLKRSTQQHYLVGLRSLLSFFAARDISSLPPEKITLPKDNDDGQIRVLNLEQLKKLFKQPDTETKTGLRDRAILETLFSTGLRVSELTDLDTSQIENAIKEDGFEISIAGKGNKSRTIYFSPRATTWIQKYLDFREDDHDPLFINYRAPDGASRRLSDRSVQKRVKKYAIAAGLPKDTTPHVLRHSFATDLLKKGVDIRILQEFLGHESITATQIYTHVTDQQLKNIHQKFHSDDLDNT